jgi:hypothetical protein
MRMTSHGQRLGGAARVLVVMGDTVEIIYVEAIAAKVEKASKK